MAGQPDPKPGKRLKDTALMRHLHLRGGGQCCICGTGFDLHLHHKRRRGQGGPDATENLTWLCGVHHEKLHRGNLTAREVALVEASSVTD